MFKPQIILTAVIILFFSIPAFTLNETEARKSHLEDIFIWKISDELKLSAREEREFTEISKSLNRKKAELNRQIQELTQNLSETVTESQLRQYKKLLQQYNDVSITEFESIKKIFGPRKFVSYLKIKNELTSKMKSILVGEKVSDKKEINTIVLPVPKVIVERAD